MVKYTLDLYNCSVVMMGVVISAADAIARSRDAVWANRVRYATTGWPKK